MLEKILELVYNPKISITVIMAIMAVMLIPRMYRYGKQTQDKKKRTWKKTKAQVTSIGDLQLYKDEDAMWVHYAFTVDGKEYTGNGKYLIAEYQLSKKVTVFYDPDDPSQNCTNLMRANMGTGPAILWLCIIAAIVILTFLFT